MLTKTVTALALLLISTAVFADDYSGGKSGGAGFMGLRGSLAFDGTISGHGSTTPPTTVKANSNVGGGVSVYWGWHLPDGFRTELELLYRYQPLSDGAINGISGKITGYTHTFAPMANGYWNLPVGDIGFNPFIGGGLGYAWNEAGVSNIAGVSFPTVHDDKWRFAYNAMAGVSIPFNASSRFTGMYRWFHEQIGVPCTSGIQCSGNLNASSIDIGIELDL